MRILLRIPDHELPEGEGSRDETARTLFRIVADEYQDEASCSDAYLHQPDSDKGLAEELDLICGVDHPYKIRDIARSWNSDVLKEFDRSIKALMDKAPTGADGVRDWFAAGSTLIYDVKKAAMALDSDFYDFAEDALLVRRYFTTVLTELELKDILDHPENYAVITVSPK